MYRVKLISCEIQKIKGAKKKGHTIIYRKGGVECREGIRSRYFAWFKDYDEAKAFLIESIQERIAEHKRQIAEFIEKLKEI